MNKKLIMFGISLVLLLSLAGCSSKVDSVTTNTSSNRFQITEKYYYIGKYKHNIVVDTLTKNLYLQLSYLPGSYGSMYNLTPLYDENGQITKEN